MMTNATTTCSVRFYAGAAEAAGTDRTVVTVPSGGTVGDLVTRLGADDQRLAQVLSVCTLLLDGQTAATDAALPTGVAAVDVLPPFAGG